MCRTANGGRSWALARSIRAPLDHVDLLAGAKIDVIYPFAPVALGTPLSIALLSYGDAYGIGIDTDPAAIPDPELLSRYLAEEVEELEARRCRVRGSALRSERHDRGRRAARPAGRDWRACMSVAPASWILHPAETTPALPLVVPRRPRAAEARVLPPRMF